MTGYLLDVNVLIAFAWPNHEFHSVAREWFAGIGEAGIRTCPITQAGFVRITSNPRLSSFASGIPAALEALAQIVDRPEHEMLTQSLPLEYALRRFPAIGHQQVTDAYLLALAEAHGVVFATLDRRLLGLAGARSEIVELIQDQPIQ